MVLTFQSLEVEQARKNQEIGGFFFFFFLSIIYLLLTYKKLHEGLAMANTKPQIQNQRPKEISGALSLQLGSVLVQCPDTGTKLK